MINKQFEAYKVKREIKRSGLEYQIKRHGTNKFGEPTATDDTVVCNVRGLYHEQNSNIQITTGDTTQIRTKKIPMVLCIWDDVTGVTTGDFIVLNNKVFNITGIVNIQEWGIIADISLEVVDDGFQN